MESPRESTATARARGPFSTRPKTRLHTFPTSHFFLSSFPLFFSYTDRSRASELRRLATPLGTYKRPGERVIHASTRHFGNVLSLTNGFNFTLRGPRVLHLPVPRLASLAVTKSFYPGACLHTAMYDCAVIRTAFSPSAASQPSADDTPSDPPRRLLVLTISIVELGEPRMKEHNRPKFSVPRFAIDA